MRYVIRNYVPLVKNYFMRIKVSVLLYSLSLFSFLSSCSTVQYTKSTEAKNFSNLSAGRLYKFRFHNGQQQKIFFSNLTKDSIVGYTSQEKTQRISIAKSDVKSSHDVRKSTTRGIATGIGVVGVTGLIMSSMRASK